MTNVDAAPVLVEVAAEVATVTLNRPHALNAITPEMLTSLARTLDGLANRDDVRVVVLTGAGRAFSAGVDLKALGGRPLSGGTVGEVLDAPAREATRLLTTIPKVVIARVNGACFTGALELVLACDLAVAADEAKLGDTHAKFGLRPTWGMSARLWRAVGPTRARELSYTARTFTGTEAAAWGLVTRSAPLDRLDEEVSGLAAAVMANSAGSLAAYKQLYRESFDVGLSEGLAAEAAAEFSIEDTESRVAAFR